MGFNVGGIYVHATKAIGQQEVANIIAAHWSKLGARSLTSNLLEQAPLELENTGALSFAILSPKTDANGDSWIAVADSERYRADAELAAALAKSLKTDVWLYEVGDSTDSARAKRFGKTTKVLRKMSEVETFVEQLPYPYFYFDDLAKQSAAKRKGIVVLGFEGIPHRPKAEYSGPTLQALKEQQVAADARGRFDAAFRSRDAIALRKLGRSVLSQVDDAIRKLDLANKPNARFVHSLAPVFMSRSYCDAFFHYFEAAVRFKDNAFITRSLQRVDDEVGVASGERYALARAQDGEKHVALGILEALTRLPFCASTVWSNAVQLLNVCPRHEIPEKRIATLLRGALATAPGNPAVLHSLARAFVFRKRFDEAIACVRDAVKYGYDRVGEMQTDKLLLPIHKDKRFTSAFTASKRTELITPAHFLIERKVSDEKKPLRLIAPAIGLHLYFANGKAAPAIGALIEKLAIDFPEMFAFCSPQDGHDPRVVNKGRVSRDVSALRKNKPTYQFELHYDSGAAEACEQRLLLDLDKNRGGELTILVPLALVKDPDALVERFIEYAKALPFSSGSAGYTLSSYYRGTRVAVKAADSAVKELHRLMPSYLGLTSSQLALGYPVQSDVVMPAWLTFLGSAATAKLGATFAKRIAPATVIDLGHGKCAIRASQAPSLCAVDDSTSCGALPVVARELSLRLPLVVGESGASHRFATFASLRRDALAKVGSTKE
jgi:tetratricopeptide (TPR) repeat protein